MLKLSEERSRRHQDLAVTIVQSDDLKGLQNFLGENAKSEVNASIGAHRLTFLHLCAIFGELRLANWLLENHAQVDKQEVLSGKTPLHLAAYYGHIELLDLFLKYSKTGVHDKVVCLPIHYACMQEHLEVVQFLIRGNENPHTFSYIGTPLDITIRKKNLQLVDFLANNMGASCVESLDKDRRKLDLHARRSLSPVHLAIATNQEEVTRLLLSKFPQFPSKELKRKWGKLGFEERLFSVRSRQCFLEYLYPPEEMSCVLWRIKEYIDGWESKLSGDDFSLKLFQFLLEEDLDGLDRVFQREGMEVLSRTRSGFNVLKVAEELSLFSLFERLVQQEIFFERPVKPKSFVYDWFFMEHFQKAGGFFRLIPRELQITTLKYYMVQDEK